MNFTQEQYIILGAIALASFLLGLILTWAVSSSRAKSTLSHIQAQANAHQSTEAKRLKDTQLQLTNAETELSSLREAELKLKQELASISSELKTTKQYQTTHQSLLDAIQTIDQQFKQHITETQKNQKTLQANTTTQNKEHFIEPFPGEGDFADLSMPATLHSDFEGFTADSEGAGI